MATNQRKLAHFVNVALRQGGRQKERVLSANPPLYAKVNRRLSATIPDSIKSKPSFNPLQN